MAITARETKDVKFEDFDPNNFRQADEVWAVYDGVRLRTFSARAHALTSFIGEYQAKLYWMQPDGMWREVAVKNGRRTRADAKCDWCNDDVAGWTSGYRWEKFGGKIPPGPDGVKLLHLCAKCREING